MTDIFGKHRFDGFVVDVFGYNKETGRYVYSVSDGWNYKIREAKEHYKYPDKRNEWLFPYGPYFYAIDLNGKKRRIMHDCR